MNSSLGNICEPNFLICNLISFSNLLQWYCFYVWENGNTKKWRDLPWLCGSVGWSVILYTKERVVGWILGQGPSVRAHTQLVVSTSSRGTYRRHQMDVCLSHLCPSLSFSLSVSLSLSSPTPAAFLPKVNKHPRMRIFF